MKRIFFVLAFLLICVEIFGQESTNAGDAEIIIGVHYTRFHATHLSDVYTTQISLDKTLNSTLEYGSGFSTEVLIPTHLRGIKYLLGGSYVFAYGDRDNDGGDYYKIDSTYAKYELKNWLYGAGVYGGIYLETQSNPIGIFG